MYMMLISEQQIGDGERSISALSPCFIAGMTTLEGLVCVVPTCFFDSHDPLVCLSLNGEI
jgi:hypothetical protein